MDAAETIFGVAKRRCYIVDRKVERESQRKEIVVINDDEDAWEALREAEAAEGGGQEMWMNVRSGKSRETAIKVEEGVEGSDPSAKSRESWKRKKWLPAGILPTLEELPKWSLLAEVLEEVEDDIRLNESRGSLKGA